MNEQGYRQRDRASVVVPQKQRDVEYWESNLACPSCKGTMKIVESAIQCEKCHSTFSMTNGVPCFVDSRLSEHQESELEHALKGARRRSSAGGSLLADDRCYKWSLEWINDRTVSQSSRVICIGGAQADDLPHVTTQYKFNIDHLAHEYARIFPGMLRANVRHIASTSEALPFRDAYADIVYSRNSLDHVSNPIKTLMEINRVLKPEGRFFLSVYYDSNFIYSMETTVIDDDFVENHLKNLFDIEWMEVCPSESESVPQPPEFSLPDRHRLGWLYAVCKKKENYKPYDLGALERYEHMTSSFHSAVYHDEKRKDQDASRFFAEVMSSEPFLKSDEMRILYSRIRYLAMNDREAFRSLFRDLKSRNRDPFWWAILIESSWSFMRDELRREIDENFAGREKAYLDKISRNMRTRGMRRFVRRHRTLFRIIEPVYNLLNRT